VILKKDIYETYLLILVRNQLNIFCSQIQMMRQQNNF